MSRHAIAALLFALTVHAGAPLKLATFTACFAEESSGGKERVRKAFSGIRLQPTAFTAACSRRPFTIFTRYGVLVCILLFQMFAVIAIHVRRAGASAERGMLLHLCTPLVICFRGIV
jgi:hypothetical protein